MTENRGQKSDGREQMTEIFEGGIRKVRGWRLKAQG
jgi:hypothetical protein